MTDHEEGNTIIPRLSTSGIGILRIAVPFFNCTEVIQCCVAGSMQHLTNDDLIFAKNQFVVTAGFQEECDKNDAFYASWTQVQARLQTPNEPCDAQYIDVPLQEGNDCGYMAQAEFVRKLFKKVLFSLHGG